MQALVLLVQHKRMVRVYERKCNILMSMIVRVRVTNTVMTTAIVMHGEAYHTEVQHVFCITA